MADSVMDGAALGPSVDIGVVGAGAMGAGIAQVAAVAGHRVRLFDLRPGAAQAAIGGIVDMFDKLVAKSRMTLEEARQAGGSLEAVETVEGLAESGLVLEAIVENVDAKRSLFQDLELVIDASALLATNTSSISITAIGSALAHPERLAGMHFFNPAPLMPLVEIISGMATRASVADRLFATALAWGKVPVRARSTPGFIVNRVARPFYGEALRLLNEGAADCATLDAVLRESGGFRMGPFELMDLIGNDVNYAVTKSVFEAFHGNSRFTPSLRQLELVEAGFLGRKTGRGFYDYGGQSPVARPQTAAASSAPSAIVLCGEDALTQVLADRLSKAGVAFELSGGHPDERLGQAGSAVVYRTDGRTATARAAANGIADCILVDLALDYETAARLAIAAADQASPVAIKAAEALLQAAGYEVSRIDDVAGMAVLRTVAMLANEAADAVNQGVCSASDADLAMRKGVNYPRGPLEWAETIGLDRIVAALDHLSEAYGEERYRVSPLLRRKLLSGQPFFAPGEIERPGTHLAPEDGPCR